MKQPNTKPTPREAEKRQVSAAATKRRQAKLAQQGLCICCGKRKANRGTGATVKLCPTCSEKRRVYARNRYRLLVGIKISAPVKSTGRPLHKPSKPTNP